MSIEDVIKLFHHGQKRKSGEPYTFHLFAVRNILFHEGIKDPQILKAALLHDVLEDNPNISKEYLSHKFGEKIADLVDLVSKKAVWKTSFCKMKSSIDEMEMALEYPEAVLIKMADRLHNLRTLSVFSIEKQKSYLRETKKLLMPLFRKIAHRKNSKQYANQIKSLIFKLNEEMKRIENYIFT